MQTMSKAESNLGTVGRITLAAGLLGAMSGVFLAVIAPQVPTSQWSYPLEPFDYALIQSWFAVQHVGLVLGIWGLWRLNRRSARLGYYAALGGMVALAITEVVAIIPASEQTGAPLVNALGVAYGIDSVLIGAGLVAMGVGMARSGVVAGWRRWALLAAGVWVFFPMLPGIALSFLAARLTISGWMVLFAVLGWILVQAPAVADPS